MDYQKELAFFQKLLENFRLKMHYITEHSPVSPANEFGLRDLLNYDYSDADVFQLIQKHCKHNVIYQFKTPLMCSYLLFQLPDTMEPTYIYVGPYTLTPISRQGILSIADQYHVAPNNLMQLEKFFHDIPLMYDETIILALLYTLGDYIWRSSDNFSVQKEFPLPTILPESVIPIPDIQTPEEALLSMQILEKRYETEHQLMQAVTNGQLHKAELFLANLSSRQYERRAANPIRNLQNYAIVLNTILRKAAENAAVHPLHIDTISSQYARKIELITSETGCVALIKEMVRKYCLMVKNHSLKGYSLLIRKVIARIDFDLTADLSLKTQAQLLNVNSSYLSTLFKKETGTTLTEYVNRKRIEHALLLLNSTDMQIQMIAQYCGIHDVNYFTKTFKKVVGHTPKEYREMITSHF